MQDQDGFLHRYFLNNGHKRLHKWVHYFDIYERNLIRFRGKSPVVLEIGVHGGGSLAMWKNFFGHGSQIIGLDIDPECKIHEEPDIEIFIGSQDDEEVLSKILAAYPSVNVVIDDGSHLMKHMIKTFEFIYPRLDSRGIYIVEDTHTCYWPKFGGGLRNKNTFMEFAKNKLDELNAFHTRGAIPVSEFTRSTESICFHDSMVVFEKRPQGRRHAPVTGPM